MEEIKSIIARNIAQLRAAAGWTQLDLAQKLHYSDKAVSDRKSTRLNSSHAR